MLYLLACFAARLLQQVAAGRSTLTASAEVLAHLDSDLLGFLGGELAMACLNCLDTWIVKRLLVFPKGISIETSSR